MKKSIKTSLLAVVMVLAMLLSACVSVSITDNSAKEPDTTEKHETSVSTPVITDNRTGTDKATFSDEDFESAGYLYENTIGDTLFFVSVKNNSEAIVHVTGNATAKDADGKSIGAGRMLIDVLGPGETSIGLFYFNGVSGVKDVDYELSYAKERSYTPVLSNLEINQYINKSNVTVSVKNTGDKSAQFVEAYALFFNADGEVVGYSGNYVTDYDCEIKPGETLYSQLDTADLDYDHVEVFFTGYADGSNPGASTIASESDFDVADYKFETTYGASVWLMVVKNNTGKEVGVFTNAAAYDSNGNIIGADDTEIDVIGTGQTSICEFYFDGVTNIDHIEYQMTYHTDLYYDDVLHSLSADISENDNNVIVAVTNKGGVPAQFVEAYALFFDENGNLVDYMATYLCDEDSEIKPDKTITGQLDTYKAYSSVEVYFSGRYSEW